MPAGKFVKMKQPLPGEQIVLSVSDEIFEAAAVNGKFAIDDDGVIVAAESGDTPESST